MDKQHVVLVVINPIVIYCSNSSVFLENIKFLHVFIITVLLVLELRVLPYNF